MYSGYNHPVFGHQLPPGRMPMPAYMPPMRRRAGWRRHHECNLLCLFRRCRADYPRAEVVYFPERRWSFWDAVCIPVAKLVVFCALLVLFGVGASVITN